MLIHHFTKQKNLEPKKRLKENKEILENYFYWSHDFFLFELKNLI
jgi:hypothetical protein